MATVEPMRGHGRPVSGKTFCEFFAGIGLVRAALRTSGWSCVYANDIEPKKRALYEAQFGKSDHFHLGDVRATAEVAARIPGRPLLATASFPCIDLSLAGHYRGLDGRHSSTFFAFTAALKALGGRRPPLVLLENVAGFLSSRKGQDFTAAARALAELGYWLDVFVLDARSFTPQSRPRVFVVGMAEAFRPTGSLAYASAGHLWTTLGPSRLRPEAVVQLMESVELPTGWAPLQLPDPPDHSRPLAECIDLGDDQEWWDRPAVERHYRMMSDAHRRQVDELLAVGRSWVGTIFRRIRSKQMRAEVRFDGLAGCLRTPRGGSAKQIVIATDGGRLRMRWMSPREYARLQGADDFPLVGKRNQLLWGFADAVCVPAVRWIDRHALTPLADSRT